MTRVTDRDELALSLVDLTTLLARGAVSPVDVTEAVLRRAERLNPTVGALLSIFDRAVDEARALERARARRGRFGPLYGVPISVKDLVLTRDGPTTAGSRTFGQGVESARDAPAVRRLRRAGAIVVGKTNLHEIAMGVTNENEHFGPARNPWNLERVAGGSSGGSAVAVALGLGAASVGTDTRGSIRIPAACCGITGLKPTRGLVSTDLVIPLSWTLDHVGPMARSVEDVALLLGVMAGSRRRLERYRGALHAPVTGLTLGICDYYFHDLDPTVDRAVREAVATLERIGLDTRPVAIPELAAVHHASTTITLAEALTYHDERLRSHPEGFGPSIRTRLDAGRALTALDLVGAEHVRRAAEDAFARVFREVDCLVAPTLPALPPPIGARAAVIADREVPTVDAFTRLNSPQNMAGVPAISVPCGLSPDGLPIGLQLIGPFGRDERALAVAAAYQRETGWHLRRPADPPSGG